MVNNGIRSAVVLFEEPWNIILLSQTIHYTYR